MDLTGIIIFASIAVLFELFFLYVASPKQLKIEFINNISIVTIYGSYFFLPFTTKITKYRDLKKAYIKERIENNKGHNYTVYDLMLEFQTNSIVVFKGKSKAETLLQYCDQINKSVSFFEDCFISEYTSISKAKMLLFLLICTPLVCFIPPKHSKNTYLQGVTNHFYILMAATGLLAVFIILSFIVNLFINVGPVKRQLITIDYNKKENVDIDSEAKRINDSLIK